MRRILLVCLFATVLAPLGTQAQEATPNHVFQRTEEVLLHLDLLNAANFSETAEIEVPDDPTRPRHVLQTARDVWRKLQLLRYMNGLPTASLDPVPSREVTPSDVKEVMDRILSGVVDLRGAYGVEDEVATPALPEGKTPTDVNANLLRIGAQLDALGVPATVPNDVFQLASTVLMALEDIARHTGTEFNTGSLWPETGRTPANVYQAVHQLIADLKTLSEADPRFAVDGIVDPGQLSGDITPADVMKILSRAMADVQAIRAAAGVEEPAASAPYLGGKTPSDVYFAVKQARAVVAALSGNGGSLF
ncbi:hypothetical protein [Psychromarinibacter sp. S121]|uniref:hypothetical protein n=1 Tax=Psychromarinibacter sp. S121 TaxID=3415127 RepID=UPI003C7B7AB2